jgi:hypothetical protein
MSAEDQKQFKDALARAKGTGSIGFFGDDRYTFSQEWEAALQALNRLAMFDMLPALDAIMFEDREWLIAVEANKHIIGPSAANRILFAKFVVEHREIADFRINEFEVNDGREFLGCTRLDDGGVQGEISVAVERAKTAIANGERGTEWATFTGATYQCCGVFKVAWLHILVPRRQVPGASLNSNLAAAAHYMLARFHVCAALASQGQMKIVIDGYDERKRGAISNGDRDLKSLAISGNRPSLPTSPSPNGLNKAQLRVTLIAEDATRMRRIP